MTLRVSRDSGQTWGPVTSVAVDALAPLLSDPGRYPACACPRCLGPRCAASLRLPLRLLDAAVRRLGDPALDRVVHCALDEHPRGQHFAVLDSLLPGPALWARWAGGAAAVGEDVELIELRDCAARGRTPRQGACALFAGHPGRHVHGRP
ncbi:hypothetical protein [Streptomyces sp. NPDC090025]|uniref:hypothetical protein n=1 Tax=Streptomyces sp. NPDC090025 TaxID=3365922 RepID=UPI003837C1AE